MKRVAQADPRAARVVAHRLAGRIEQLVQRLVGDSEASDAVTVRALVEILQSAGSYRGAVSIEAWADDIGARAALSRVRKRRRRWFELGARTAAARLRRRAAATEGARTSEHPLRLVDCLARLSDAEREVLVLRHTLGASAEQIEALTGRELATVQSQLRSGSGALRGLGEKEAASQPLCRAELALFDELARRDAAPSAQGRALVDAALAQLAVKAQQADQGEVTRVTRSSRAPRLWWSAAILAGVALVMLLYSGRPEVPREVSMALWPASRVQLIYAAGEVLVDGIAATPAAMQLAEGSTLEVRQGSACVAFDAGGALCGGPQTRVRFSRTHGLWRRLDLEAGQIMVRLPPQPRGARMSVVARGVWATSQGATFSMHDEAEGGVRSGVHGGTLEIRVDGGQPLDLRTRQQASIRDGATRRSVLRDADAAAERELLAPAEFWHKPLASTLDLRGVPASAEVWLDERILARSPLLARIPLGAHTLSIRADDEPLTSLTFTAEFEQLTALSIDGRPRP
jgi:RNA polymerase sigma-70 factor, ECF subfamily